jgi:hypothetical protein
MLYLTLVSSCQSNLIISSCAIPFRQSYTTNKAVKQECDL